MPNTTNYNWATPADTDLVKDGAAAIRTLGSSADTTVKNLNPGTTAGDIDYYTSSTAKARVAIGTAGQVLRVNSGGTAPEWATTADQTPLTTKGDLFTFDTADARLGVGANGTVLTADSTEATGLKWVAASAGATDWTLLNAGGTNLTGATSITVSGISAKELMVLVLDASTANTQAIITLRPNNLATGIYNFAGLYNIIGTTYNAGNFDAIGEVNSTATIRLFQTSNNAADTGRGYCYFDKADQTGAKSFHSGGSGRVNSGTGDQQQFNSGGFVAMSAAITSITVVSNSGNFDAGKVYVYGAN